MSADVTVRMLWTADGDRDESRVRSSAAAPATCGAENDDPLDGPYKSS